MRGLALTLALVAASAAGGRAQEPATPGRTPTGPGAGALRIESEVSIRVVPDPVAPGDSLTVGDPFWATVVSTGPRGYYLLPESVADAYRPRPELAVLDTDRRDGRLRLRLALFRVGDVVLPEVNARVVDTAGDTLPVRVLSDTIRVASVLAPGDTLLADIKPLWEPASLPVWIVWALAAAALLLLALLWWWWRRRRTRAETPAVRPSAAVDPYAAARERIEIAGRRGSAPAERIEAASEIGDALRDYLAGAWRVPARERTTFELLGSLPSALRTVRPALGALFAEVDLAKFARVDPGADELRALAGRGVEVLDRMQAVREPPVATDEDAREAAS